MNSLHQSTFAYRSLPPMHHDQLRHPAALPLPRKKLQRRPFTSYNDYDTTHMKSYANGYHGTVTAKLTDEKLLERRTFSTMALLNSLAGGDCCDDIAEKHQQYQVDQQAHQRHQRRRKPYEYHGGVRPDYKLGDMLRSPHHLITEPSYKRFISSIQALNKHEFAFIKRSNGSYSYAILAHRSMEPVKQGVVASSSNNGEVLTEEEYMIFVMNETGSTKRIRKHMWGEHVRLVAEYPQEEQVLEGVYNNAAPPPNIISCTRLTYDEDDCSSVSSTSEYARYYEKYFC